MHDLLSTANELAKSFPWDALAATGVISPLLVGFKKWLSIQSERVMISLVALLSFLTVAGHYLLTTPSSSPKVLAYQSAVLAFMTQPVYFFFVKPAFAWLRTSIEKSDQLNKDIKSAAQPASGINVGTSDTTKV